MKLKIDGSKIGNRVDWIVLDSLQELEGPIYKNITRSSLANIFNEVVRLNNEVVKKGVRVSEADVLTVDEQKVLDLLKMQQLASNDQIIAQKGSLNIIDESDDWLVINKPSGLVMHPGDGNADETLANYIRYYLESKNQFDLQLERAGIVHRLDKGVSGLLIIAKNRETQLYLKELFENHEVNKVYLAKLETEKADITEDIDPKTAIEDLLQMDYKVDESWQKFEGWINRDRVNRKRMKMHQLQAVNSRYSLMYMKFLNTKELLIKLETGRMHQIRAGLKLMGLIIEGDTLYRNSKGENPDKISLTSTVLSFTDIQGDKKEWRLI